MIIAVAESEKRFNLTNNDETVGYVEYLPDEEYCWRVTIIQSELEYKKQCKSKGTIIALIEGQLSKLKMAMRVDLDSVVSAYNRMSI